MRLLGVCDEVTFEVMALHERLMVEVRDCSVLDVATNIEHLKSVKYRVRLTHSIKSPCKCPKDSEAEAQRGSGS